MEIVDEAVDARSRIVGKYEFGVLAPGIGEEDALGAPQRLDVALLKAVVEHGLGGGFGKTEVQQMLVTRAQMCAVELGHQPPQGGIFRQTIHANSCHPGEVGHYGAVGKGAP